jgi:uncharacterized protein YvpB
MLVAKRLLLFSAMAWLTCLVLTAFTPVVAAKSQAENVPEKVVLQNFPVYAQWHNLSCEYSSTRMMTAFWGKEIGEPEFIANVPFNQDPHIGFRGDIDQWFGGTWHYGIYGEPIARFIETRGFKTKFLTGRDVTLRQELALGRPVQVWTMAGMGWTTPFTEEYENKSFLLAPGEHSVVVYGYDSQGVYIADPAYGGRAYYGWETFMRSWSYLGYMAMSIYPAEQAQPNEKAIGVATEFYRHWINTGGINVIGHPIAPATVENGRLIQYFERARLEMENPRPNGAIEHGLLGTELFGNRLNEEAFRKAQPLTTEPTAVYFEATGHNLMLGFREYWTKNGGLMVFGYPTSEEINEDGKIVQYFERAKFEYYPDNPEPYKILLARLGAERLTKSNVAVKN